MGITWKNLLIFGASVGLAGLWIGNAPADDDAVFPMPRGKTFLSECGSCHTAYAPGLLPVGDPVVQVAAAEYHAQANGRSRISNDRLAAAVRRLEALGPQPKPPASCARQKYSFK